MCTVCKLISILNVWMLCYTGSVQTFTAPSATTYKLEVWGAQGGVNQRVVGGKGGYSYGNKTLVESTNTLYVVIGGQGNYPTTMSQDLTGGYNGGGYAYHWKNNDVYQSSGGGATHIASGLASGTLSENVLSAYSATANRAKILIVAGGGGGGCTMNSLTGTALNGGTGGGETGGDAPLRGSSDNSTYGKGGTQSDGGSYVYGSGNWPTNAGAFGKGGDSNSTYGGASGGGGWFGGGGASGHGGGGGGSGYIGGVKNGKTIAGNASMPKPTGGTETGHTGNGYCKITWHPAL